MEPDFTDFVASVNQLGHFNPDQISRLLSRIQVRALSKGHYLLKAGQTCRDIWYVQQGSLLHSNLHNDEEAVLNLYVKNDWVLDHESFTLQKPSQNIIRAFSEVLIYGLGIHDLHRLIEESPSYFQLGRVLEHALAPRNSQRSTPSERYSKLLSEKPQLVQTFPLKYIASYLEITPETLSRIRRKIQEYR